MLGVVIATQSVAEPVADKSKRTEGRDQGDFERVPEQVSEVGLCVWMHWHGLTSLLSGGYCPRGFVRTDVEHSLLIDGFIFIVQVHVKQTGPEQGGENRHQQGDAKRIPGVASTHIVACGHGVRVEQVQSVDHRQNQLEHGQRQEHAPAELEDLIRTDSGQSEPSPNEDDQEDDPSLEQRHDGAGNEQIGIAQHWDGTDGSLEGEVPAAEEKVGKQETRKSILRPSGIVLGIRPS